MQVVDAKWGLPPEKPPRERSLRRALVPALLALACLALLARPLQELHRWAGGAPQARHRSRLRKHDARHHKRRHKAIANETQTLSRERGRGGDELTCDELVLPFDSSSGGGLVFDSADGVRGARRMPRLLANNRSLTASVAEDDYDFFQLCVSTERSFRFTIEVTHAFGNPDLYISFSQPWPYVGNSDIISANIVRERVSVSTEADIVQEAFAASAQEGPHVPAVIFISVFGREASTYTISAVLEAI